MSGETLTVVYFLVVLKIPVLAMIALLFWAAQRVDAEPEIEGGDDGGQSRRPRWPRRGGPHGSPPPQTAAGHQGRRRLRPERVRVLQD